MGKWLQWIILTSITGSPLLSIVLLLVFWWAVDRYTLGILPDPLRFIQRWQRTWKLERTLATNPHDRRTRLELAELYVGQRRYAQAVETLKPNLQAGDDDPATLFVMGNACYGAGHAQQAEVFWSEAEGQDAKFRVGAIHLERGRWRLKKGDAAGAQAALHELLRERQGTIEGRVLLSRAMLASGDEPGAALMRDEAWREYVSAPRFQRRVERFWAWRAKPWRPVLYVAVLAAVGATAAYVARPLLSQRSLRRGGMYDSPYSRRAPAPVDDDEP